MPPVVIILTNHAEAHRFAGEVIVVTDAATLGKGVALKKGLAEAAEKGFTHAITMDGWHSADDLPKFIDAIEKNPDAIIVGARQGLPRSIRMARAHCDFWVWAATGRWICDTPNGFRAYPLTVIFDLSLRCDQFDFEIEVLVKAMWAGAAVVQLPVSSGGGSELIPFGDAARLGWLTTVLVSQKLLLPGPLLSAMHKKEFADLPLGQRVRRIARDAILLNCDHGRSFAACIGLGVFFGILPIWGFQMLAAAAVAHALGLSKPLVLAASNISSPITIPFILYFSLIVGHLLHRGQFEGLPRLSEFRHSPLLGYLGEYVVGSIVLAVVGGIAAALLAYAAASALKAVRGKGAC